MALRLKSGIRVAATVIAVASAMILLGRGGHLLSLDRLASDVRTAAIEREAGGEIVFLGIDKKSLDALRVWPWPRETYGRIIDSLVADGAREIFLDIDLSAASRPEADAALAAALERAGGGVLLPAFVQNTEAGGASPAMSANLPLPLFRGLSWMTSVNVVADSDGVLRHYPYGLVIEGEGVPSVAAFLSGVSGPTGTAFEINYAIAPGSIPAFSVIDLLEGRLDPATFLGKSVVVGAHAVELRDNLSVPVHGILAGSVIQILAAETLKQGVAIRAVDPAPWIALLATLVMTAAALRRRARFRHLLAGLLLAGLAIELLAFHLLSRHAVMLPTAGLQGLLFGTGGLFALHELDLHKWLLLLAQIDKVNSQRVLARIFADSSDAIIVVDETGGVLEWSGNACLLFRTSAVCVKGADLRRILPDRIAKDLMSAMVDLRRGIWTDPGMRALTMVVEGGMRHIEYRVTPSRLSDVRERAVTDDRIVASITARDITVRRVQEERLERIARFDTLTGALSRSEFVERLDADLAKASPEARSAVVVINLHRFSVMNATLGRSVGDALLQAVVARLKRSDTGMSAPARVGGDWFAVSRPCGEGDDGAAEMAAGLVALVSEPFELEGTVVRVGAHAGVSVQRSGAKAAALLGDAELALDEARKAEGGAVRLHDPASVDRQRRARLLETALWNSIENGELFLAYQPQIRLSDMSVIGAEALVRWRHPELGMIGPDEFIAIAEGNGFIETLGRWAMGQAARDALTWPNGMTVAVNVSPVQLRRGDVVADAARVLRESGLPANRLHLEITESIFVDGNGTLLEKLHDLRMMGIRLALDDFGSGFSSFSYLAKLPLDKIKLDRMFVQTLAPGDANAAIVKSVLMLSRELGYSLVCEGVETEEQRDFLRDLGCDEGQGFLFGRPQPQTDLLAMAS